MDKYLVNKDGSVVEWSEKKLRRKLREGDLSGLELARPEDQSQWQPLHELDIFSEEVPHQGDPRDVARRRMAKGLAWHVLIYGVVTSMLFGAFSIPGAIWGLFLIAHASKALPPTWALLREGKLLGSGPAQTALPGESGAQALPSGSARAALAAPTSGATTQAAPSPRATGFAADLTEVQSLLSHRPAAEAAPILEQLTRIATTVSELSENIERLDALVAEDEAAGLHDDLKQAESALAETSEPQDAALHQRRVEVLRDRVEADHRARRTLERLRIREDLAHQQVRQLRVDLVRAEANQAVTEDLGSRLEQIRLEAEAAEEVDNLLARRD